MSLPAPVSNSLALTQPEKTGNHISYCMKLVKMVEKIEYAARLSQSASQEFAMTVFHPAGNEEEGQSRKDLWPPPEGTPESISDDRDPLVKMQHGVSCQILFAKGLSG